MKYSYIYKYKPEDSQETSPKESNKEPSSNPILKENHSKVKVLGLIIISAILLIIYVSNVIEIKSLMRTNYEMNKKREMIENRNQILRQKINQLESPERITKIAKENLGMNKSESTPTLIK